MKQEISSKYSFINSLWLLSLFATFFLIGILSFDHAHYFFSLIIWIFLALYLWDCIRYFPKVFTISREGVKISSLTKSTVFPWEEVEKIDILSDENFTFLFIPLPCEATSIYLKNGKKIKICVYWYANIAHLRIILERASEIILYKKRNFNLLSFSKIEHPSAVKAISSNGPQIVFKKRPFSKINRYVFYGMLILFWFLGIAIEKEDGIVGGALLAMGAYFMVGLKASYFIITDDSFIVKNSIFFWVHKVYLITHIKEAVFRQGAGNGPSNNITLILNNYKEKSFQSENLQQDTWRQLFNCLLSRGVRTRIYGTYLSK